MKPIKKILIATNHLNGYGGSEMWTYTMWKGFKNHFPEMEVDLFSVDQSSPMKAVTDAIKPLEYILSQRYDLKLINHKNVVDSLRFVPGKTIQTIHGLYSEFETPSNNADAWVYISHEIRKNIEDRIGPKPGTRAVILNPVDDERFNSFDEPNKDVLNILCLCQGEKAMELVRLAGIALDVTPSFHNKNHNPLMPWDLATAMENSNIVIGIGRGAMEAMVSDRAVILMDSRSYVNENKILADGFMTSSVYHDCIYKNLSGRHFNIENPSLHWLMYQIQQAVGPQSFKKPGNLTYSVHRVRNVINEYLNL